MSPAFQQNRRRRLIAIAYVLIVAALAVMVAVPEHPSFAAYAGLMLLAAPLSLVLYLPYYVISLGVLPADGKWLWLFHVAWYAAIAVVQAWLTMKYLDRRQRRKAAA
ncbi:SCO4225 family membrane protein [Kribbella sp. NPDC055110]